jgi:hypothetical protein
MIADCGTEIKKSIGHLCLALLWHRQLQQRYGILSQSWYLAIKCLNSGGLSKNMINDQLQLASEILCYMDFDD